MARLYFDKDDRVTTGGRNPQAVVEDLQARDPVRVVPDSFVLVARASLMLRGLGHMLNQHRSCAAAWAPLAEGVLRAAGEDPAEVLPQAEARLQAYLASQPK